MLNIVLAYLRSGLCVLPAILTEKRPALPGWKQYQHRLPTEQQVQTWFANASPVCVLAGEVSGHLEMIDFDHGGELYEAWRNLVVTEAPELVDRVVVESSQSGGRHVIYRCSVPIPGIELNTPLIRVKSRNQVQYMEKSRWMFPMKFSVFTVRPVE